MGIFRLFKVAIFTATSWEYRAVRRAFAVKHNEQVCGVPCLIGGKAQSNIFLFQTGIGPQKAFEVCRNIVANADWHLVVSTGFAGALAPAPIGSLLVARHVLRGYPFPSSSPLYLPIPCDHSWSTQAFRIGLSCDPRTRSGGLITVSRVLVSAAEKQDLAARSHAVGVDMESAAVGQIAEEHGVPFVVVRTISDLVDEDLPFDFNVFFGHWGWIRGTVELGLNPRGWKGLAQLGTHVHHASQQLTKFFDKFLTEVSPFSVHQGPKPIIE